MFVEVAHIPGKAGGGWEDDDDDIDDDVDESLSSDKHSGSNTDVNSR
jgi:hypothetical protein